MKVDLDELEDTAKAATPGPWSTTKPGKDVEGWQRGVMIGATMGGKIYGDPPGGQSPAADARHIAANSPDVTLALVARIRELEDEALAAARTIEGWVTCETQFPVREDDPDWKQAERIRALVEKGINHE